MSPTRAFELTLLLLAVAVCLSVAARRLRTPPSVAFVIGGMALSVTPGVPALEIDPALIMAIFLPPLLQSSAYFTMWREFRANIGSILMLALGAVAFTTLVVGWVAHALIPGLPWAACFAFGAIVSPPDAVAAAAVLERLHMPRRLLSILEGESLINDASGLVLYRFAVAAALTGAVHPVQIAGSFVVVCVGGVAIGWLVAAAATWVIRRLGDVQTEITVTFLSGWASYLAAEAIGVSGVLAVVSCGLTGARILHTHLSARTRQEARIAWSFVLFVLDALVFILIGLSLHGVWVRLGGSLSFDLLRLAAVMSLTVVAARFLWLLMGAWLPGTLFCLLARRTPFITIRPLLVVAWSGMRGVVSLAAALALPPEFPGRDLLLFLTFCVILVSLLLHGTTLGPVIVALGVSEKAPPGGPEPVRRARVIAAAAARDFIERQAQDPLEGAIARDLIDEYRTRDRSTGRMSAANAAQVAERAARLSLRLRATDAAREALSRAGETIDEESLRLLERELDLEEIQLRQRAGEW